MIRRAEAKDASRLAEILIFTKRCSYRNIFKDDFTSFGTMQVLPLALSFQNDSSALERVFVWDDGIVKAMIQWGTVIDRQMELCQLYVDPFFHGEGIGTKLMEAFLLQAEQNKCKNVWLWVLEQNQKARKFYESFGFQFCGEKKEQPGCEGFFLLKYQKTLK